jgi:hypothetical protein
MIFRGMEMGARGRAWILEGAKRLGNAGSVGAEACGFGKRLIFAARK